MVELLGDSVLMREGGLRISSNFLMIKGLEVPRAEKGKGKKQRAFHHDERGIDFGGPGFGEQGR